MANAYSQIHLHIVFAVKYRNRVLQNPWRQDLYKYITAIIQNKNHKLLAINGVEDHIHILIGYRPSQPLPELMQAVKKDSSVWINKNGLVKGKFEWQAGYGVFAFHKSKIPVVIRYILTQEEHHK